MDGDKQRADRFLNIALRAIREAAQAGDGVARYGPNERNALLVRIAGQTGNKKRTR